MQGSRENFIISKIIFQESKITNITDVLFYKVNTSFDTDVLHRTSDDDTTHSYLPSQSR